jgi:type II secretory pathway pseudopilin PulG
MNERKRRSADGYSMVELAVVLAILGVVVGGSLYGVEAWRGRATERAARTTLGIVEDALTYYVLANHRLPCPDTGGDGGEDCGGGTVVEGTVPYGDLGLTEAEARDGWNHPVRYAVLNDLTTVVSGDSPMACPEDLTTVVGGLIVDVDPGDARLQAAYAVISAGEDGVLAAENGDGDATFTETTGDDIVASRNPGKVMVDGGCKLARLDPYSSSSGDANTGVGDQTALNSNAPNISKLWIETQADASSNGKRTAEPVFSTEDEDTVIAFQAVDGNTKDARACLWYNPDLRLKDSVIRVFMEVSFRADPTEAYGHGLVNAYLPWEVSASAPDNSHVARCGGSGPYLGFGDTTDGTGSEKGTLYDNNDFTGTTLVPHSAMPIGVELDTAYTPAPKNNKPPFNDVNSETHMAVVVDNVYHNTSPGGDIYPNPACTPSAQECSFNDGDPDWMEAGSDAYHMLRIEIDDQSLVVEDENEHTGDNIPSANERCPGRVEVRAWLWEAGTTCQGDCKDLSEDFDDSSETNVHAIHYCLNTDRNFDRKSQNLLSWFRIRPGITAGLMPSANNSNTKVKNWSSASELKHVDLTTAGIGDTYTFDSRDYNSKAGMNSAVVDKSGGNWSRGVMRTSWIPWDDQNSITTHTRVSAAVSSSYGEIAVNSDFNQGFGVFGIGGSGTENPLTGTLPQLDSVEPATDIDTEIPYEREALIFNLDKAYKTFALRLTDFKVISEEGEKARVLLFRTPSWNGGNLVGEWVEFVAEACVSNNGAVEVKIDGGGAEFTALKVMPEPTDGGARSGFWVQEVKACGTGDATSCTVRNTYDCSVNAAPSGSGIY